MGKKLCEKQTNKKRKLDLIEIEIFMIKFPLNQTNSH